MNAGDPSPDGIAPASPEALRAVAAEYGLECLLSVSDEVIDPELVRHLPVEWARTNAMLPVRLPSGPCVLMAAPGDVARLDDVQLVVGCELRPVLAPREAILNGIERCYFRRRDTPGDFLKDIAAAPASARGADTGDLLRVSRDAPVTQLVNLILLDAVKQGASDIHVEPFESRLRIRYRIDGVLYEQSSPPKHLEESLVSRLKVMARLDIAERRLPQDGMARVSVGEREIDVRVSTVPVAEGERVVLRLLDQRSALLPLPALGMPAKVLEGVGALLACPNGMVVVCGPTGSGKTTTLYAALSNLDASRRNILTIEDPIEYQLSNIGQIQVKPKIGLTFAAGLRHILRQDPDVILVGETRDLETAEVAVRASLTGHLVFTTLHTNDAAGAVVRLLDMGVEPYLLASCLRGILAQRLVRRLCPACRRPVEPEPEELRELGERAQQRLRGVTVYAASGCAQCLEGYRGRIGIFELLALDAAMQRMIRSGASASDDLRAFCTRRDLRTLLDDGLDKVAEGATTLGEVLGVAAG
jgi:general secretion pathway protein E